MKGSALATTSTVSVRTSEPPRLQPLSRLREIAGDREILANLVRKEVKVKYKSSVLGAAWSMLNPILYLAVFSLVFGVVLKNNVPDFSVYLLSGILAWNLFSTSLALGARSVVDNANLVTKVYFPREILPLASIGAAGVDFVLQAIVLVVFMAALRHPFIGVNLLLLPLAIAALLAFTAALTMFVASLNVRYRDTQHLLNLALLTWFWVTPVVYQSALVFSKLQHHRVFGISLVNVYLANPMADVAFGFQRALYRSVSPVANVGTRTHPKFMHVAVTPNVSVAWLALLLGAVTLGCLGLLVLAWRTFFHLSGEVEEGSTLGLIGPNGSGKTTLLKIIAGILRPTNGRVVTRGRIASLLALGAGFHPELTGRENVYLNASILGLSRQETDRLFDAIVEFAELRDFIDTQVKFYSSGMFVRLGFAVAVHVDPAILLVDEVLAVGDIGFQRKCLDKVEEFQREGRTIVFVTHQPDQVLRVCDRAVVLNRGNIVNFGEPQEVVRDYRLLMAKHDLAYGWDRGTKEIEIVSAELFGADGSTPDGFAPGDELTIQVDLRANVVVENPVVSFAIHDDQ